MRSFWAGVATTVVFLFVSLFFFGVAMRGLPQAIDCVNYKAYAAAGKAPATRVEVTSTRRHGFFRTYTFPPLGCRAYWHRSNKDEHFR
jgi:hypothetical protein